MVRGKQRTNTFWISIGKQQWGSYQCPKGNSYRTITYTYPIAFTSACYGTFPVDNLGDIDRSYVNTFAVTNISTTSFNIWIAKGEASTYRMIAIGIQQWGSTPTTKGTHTITFPIAFSNQCYALTQCGKYASGVYSDHVANVNVLSTSQFNMGTIEQGAYWIAVGKQQWGKATNANKDTRTATTLPLAMTTAYVAVEARRLSDSSGSWDWCSEIQGLNTTTVYTRSGGGTADCIYFIVIGKAQRNGEYVLQMEAI